ncbi:unnamed protein product, partial [Mesorhabditis belari]|uniref:Uncharacterized protein n=1 Tax=Mesorhabditis belari TaxID=2138241 RepID=A0AAF3FEY0_9BILA
MGRSTAQAYYNRAWWRRQQVEAVKHEALALTTQTPVLFTIYVNRTAALKSDAPGIQMSQIYGKRQDVDDLFDD